MSLIEGVGDEVTAFFAILLLLLVICLAWVSTNIRDIPFFSVIIVELTQGRRRVYTGSPTSLAEQAAAHNGTSAEQNQGEQEGGSAETPGGANEEAEESPQNIDTVLSESVEGTINPSISGESANEPTENENIPSVSPSQNVEAESSEHSEDLDSDSNLSETELRRRRIDFFQKQTSTDLHQSASVSVEENFKSENLPSAGSCVQSHIKEDSSSQPVQVPENRSRTDVIQSESRSSNQSETSRSDSNSEGHLASDNSGGNNSGTEQQSENVGDRGDDSIENHINIRLKYLNDTQRSVSASPRDTIGQFRRANFAAELSENKLVRFIFNGQDLRNDANTLQAYNIVDNSVIHCLITNDNRNNAAPMMHQENGFDIGILMLPLFGFLICLVWYLRFEYRQFFTATSTVSLIGVTFLFIAAVLASWEGHRRGHAHEHVE